MDYYGSVQENQQAAASTNHLAVIDDLRRTYLETYDEIKEKYIAFPDVSREAEDEFNGIPIFSNAFPWLFPGGIGDIDKNNLSDPGYVTLWLKHMIHYYDGRFNKDPTFCFYALNFKQRHQNNTSGRFFVNGFIQAGKPTDLEHLKEQISKGDKSWIEKLVHYSQKVRGSSAYWRSKKYQLISWINWLIHQGKGPPTLFITLSCAEHYWWDIKRLLQQRMTLEGRSDIILRTKADVVKAVKNYTVVVQEYFITKVDDWLNNFAKHVFHIEHYFARFEFTEGRGEIHAHILAAANNMDVYLDAYKCGDDVSKKTSVIQAYAENVLGLTAMKPSTENGSIAKDLTQFDACSKKYSEIIENNHDALQLIEAVQVHRCGDYCMRGGCKRNKKNRYCRAGCGTESTYGLADTPGFKTRENAKIVRDQTGSYRLLLPRNDERMVQTSIPLLQCWRANCDVQLLIYMSDPRNPSVDEISKITDYVVSYTCKGNTSQSAEAAIIANLISR